MHLHEWLNRHYKTDILRFEHLGEYVQATPKELETCIELINPWYNILLKSSDGVEEMSVMNSLERKFACPLVVLGRPRNGGRPFSFQSDRFLVFPSRMS